MESKYCLFGDIVYSVDKDTLACQENGYLVIEEGFVAGVYRTLEAPYDMYPVYDYKGYLILPGMTDLHVHAPQYTFKGMGMDLELLDWLNTYTFAEESKYASLDYANKAYEVFVDRLKNSTTTRACIFSTIHNEATLALMDRLETSGLVSMVGKVNMDRNASASLLEKHSLIDTKNWIHVVKERAYQNTSCILTPRFIPSCTDELMKGLSTIQKQYDLPVQSHLSENQSEIAWVQELCPWSNSYADAYAQFDLLGNTCKTIMAHCVYLDDADQNLLKERGVYVAHCPESNINLASGIAPIKTYLEKGMKVGLGSDVAAGSSESLLRAMSYAIQASKMYWRLVDQTVNPLSVEEVFYLATMSGGSFFGRVGSFQPEYEFDAVVIQDSRRLQECHLQNTKNSSFYTYSLRELSQRSQLIRSAFFIYLAYTLTYIGMVLYQEGDLKKIYWMMILFFGINFILLMFAYVLVYMLEKMFGYVSSITLVELANINTAVLKKLSETCPGTFQHSLQVSILASEAATRIGADAQLVRTGAMYHDIGKMSNPAFFTENQNNFNPHTQLAFDESAQIIISHVNEGVKIAEKASLPKAVIDFIRTHHGKGKAKYFYNSFRNKYPDREINEELFTYPGPNPFSKETAILMMADSVEATSRSLKEYSEENIREMVDKIIDSQIADGLLKNAPLTFRDVETIKDVFTNKLKIMYHTRISYPDLKK